MIARLYNKLALFKKNHELFSKIISENINIGKKEKILDFGCGTGAFCKIFPKESYVGVDVDIKRIKLAKTNYKGYQFLRITPGKTDFKENYFDVIIAIGVFHHINNDMSKKSLMELKRILKKNGRLFFIEPIFKNDTKIVNMYMALLEKMGDGYYIRHKENYLKLFNDFFQLVKIKEFKNKLYYNECIFDFKNV